MKISIEQVSMSIDELNDDDDDDHDDEI